MDELREKYAEIAVLAEEDLEHTIQSSIITMLIAAIGILIIGLLAAVIITRGISKPLSSMAIVAEAISTGDINHSIEVKSKDEIGVLAGSFNKLIGYMSELAEGAERIAQNDITQIIEPKSEDDILGNSFKTMTVNLRKMVTQLTENSEQLVTAANEIASTSEEMAQGANNQTGQAEQISSAIEEMSATILESSQNANTAKEISEGASSTANQGQEVVRSTINGMIKIAGSASESNKIVNELAKASDKIGEIISVIDDIADQTNLLALNAAIEAARAGEQGRGFAVVADEVRKLAERTGKATSEITDMINGIQSDSSRAVSSLDTAVKLVEDGKEYADKAGNSLDEISSMSSKVMDMICQMAVATDEQSAAAEQISKNMEQISSIARQTASGSEQSATAAEQLSCQAEGMREMVGHFKV
ncbi:MAG: methyl-accepting chemotaxis protein [candidate division Zixibacteria bacterium]|nr:methyl-accepting chemotaxis protein [candidate division Zixibacteria bacterium]